MISPGARDSCRASACSRSGGEGGEGLGEDLGVAVDVGLGVVGAEQRHVVERRQQHAPVEAPQVQEALEVLVDGGGRGGAVARGRAEPVLRAAAEPLDVPGQAVLGDDPGDALGEPLGERDRDREVLLAQAGREGGPDRRGRQGVGRSGCRRPRRRRPRPRSSGRASRSATSALMPYAAHGMPPPIGLPTTTKSGSSPQAAVQPPGPAQSVCVSSMTSSTSWRRVISRTAGRGSPSSGSTMPMLVSAGSISRQATSPSREPPVERVRVVERHHGGRLSDVDLRAHRAGPGHHPVTVEDGQRLVDGAVVAPVHHRDPRPPGQVPGEAQHEPVRVGGRHRQLPRRQPEPAGQLLADPDRVGRRAASW